MLALQEEKRLRQTRLLSNTDSTAENRRTPIPPLFQEALGHGQQEMPAIRSNRPLFLGRFTRDKVFIMLVETVAYLDGPQRWIAWTTPGNRQFVLDLADPQDW